MSSEEAGPLWPSPFCWNLDYNTRPGLFVSGNELQQEEQSGPKSSCVYYCFRIEQNWNPLLLNWTFPPLLQYASCRDRPSAAMHSLFVRLIDRLSTLLPGPFSSGCILRIRQRAILVEVRLSTCRIMDYFVDCLIQASLFSLDLGFNFPIVLVSRLDGASFQVATVRSGKGSG